MNKDEYKKIQRDILQFLFDKGRAATFGEITTVTKKAESETQYHCDVLREQGVIEPHSVPAGSSSVRGYIITVAGRKAIMEQ